MQAADLSHHTSTRFNEELERVRGNVLAMGGFVEEQLSRSLTALVEGDSALGRAVGAWRDSETTWPPERSSRLPGPSPWFPFSAASSWSPS